MTSRTSSKLRVHVCDLSRLLIKCLDYINGLSETIAEKRKLSEPAQIENEDTSNHEPLLLYEFTPEERKDSYTVFFY